MGRRAGEAEDFRDHYNIPLIHAHAARSSFGKLAGATDPEQKRKHLFGATFIDVFDAEAEIGGAEFLAQGTLYPNVIEFRRVHRRPQRHHQVAPAEARADYGESGARFSPVADFFQDRIGRSLCRRASTSRPLQQRYQTVYAREPGIATAGLHFTPE